MPPVFPGERADSLEALADRMGLPRERFLATVAAFNAACRVGQFDHAVLDDCHTEGLSPPKTHWALPIDTPPYAGYALRPGITFTYLGVRIDAQSRVRFGGQASPNLFAAGEVMAGNVLGQGYTAGVGMTIGTVFGRVAGTSTAAAVVRSGGRHAALA